MPLAIKNKAGDEIVRVFPDPRFETGLVAIVKRQLVDGRWGILYGSRVLRSFDTEDDADATMCSILLFLNEQNPDSAKTVSEIEARS
jgi:hypothetical protein